MLKFKMTNSADCDRCGAKESTKHLVWDFPFSQMAWIHLNDILEQWFSTFSRLRHLLTPNFCSRHTKKNQT